MILRGGELRNAGSGKGSGFRKQRTGDRRKAARRDDLGLKAGGFHVERKSGAFCLFHVKRAD
jgi:hypothetical protein